MKVNSNLITHLQFFENQPGLYLAAIIGNSTAKPTRFIAMYIFVHPAAQNEHMATGENSTVKKIGKTPKTDIHIST